MQSTVGAELEIHPVKLIRLDAIQDRDTGSKLHILNTIQLEGHTFSRFFFFTQVSAGEVRGDHAHRECVQLLIPLEDGVQMEFRTQEGFRFIIPSKAGEAILVPPMVWVRLKFLKASAAFLVAATLPFSEEDYIRDESEFFL